MNFKRLVSVPILAVLLLLGSVYYITVFVFIQDWVGFRSSSGCLNSLIFTCLSSLCLFSFVVCVFTDPGHVPASYTPDVEDTRILNSIQLKPCDKCSTHKPPRAHHCRVCRTCVLRMDHHCTWINNCVGYWNYKAFFVLIFYAMIGSIYSAAIIITCAFQKDWELSKMIRLKVLYVICGVMMVSLSLILGTLLGWHVYLIIHNMTTIEYYEGIRAAWMAKKSGQNYRHPFDLGAYKNITMVLGPNMLKWAWPSSVSHLKDGLAFPISRESS